MKAETVNIFSIEDKKASFKTKRKYFFIWLACFVVYLGIVLTMFSVNLYRVQTNFDRSGSVAMQAVCVVLTIIFAGGSLFFFSIKYKLTRKYCKMLKDIDNGIKDEADIVFKDFDNTISMKDGVFFYSMVCDSKPLRRGDITERKVLIEHTLDKLDFSEGDKMRITTHANILVSYKILSKKDIFSSDNNTTENQ